MRTKVTLVLLFLNVVLFAFLYWVRSSIHEPQEKGGILGPEVVNLQKIEIAATGRPAVRLEKRADTWMLTSPLSWPANEFAVTRILNELQQLRSEANFAVKDLEKNGVSLADYGLEKPLVVLTLTPAGSGTGPAPAPTVLRIGDTAKVGNRLYVLSPDGARVHVVSRSLVESLLVKMEDLRSDTIFSVQVFEVRSLNLVTGAPASSKVRLARASGRWTFETPITTRANKNETDITINRLNKLRIQGFTDPRASNEPLRLTPEEMTLKVTLEGNNRHESLVLGARVREAAPAPDAAAATAPAPRTEAGTPPAAADATELYYAKMEDKEPVFTVAVPVALLDTLRNAQEALRDRQILDLDPASVTAITLSAPGRPDLTLQRLEPNAANPLAFNWQILRRGAEQGPQTVAADREIVDKLIQRLIELSALDFVSDAPIETMLEDKGFNRPALRIKISVSPAAAAAAGAPASTSSVTLLLGIGVDRRTYAKLESPNYIYRVSDQILQQTPVEPLAYRDRTLRELPPGARISGLRLVDLADQKVLLETALPLAAANGNGNGNGTAAAAQVGTAAPAPATAAQPDLTPATRAAVDALVTQLRSLRAKRFVRDEFTKTVVVSGEDRPWRYQLTTTLTLIGGNGSQTATPTLFFSERAGGNVQLAGSPDYDVVFEVEPALMDALFTLTYGPRDPGPTPPTPEKEAAAPTPAP